MYFGGGRAEQGLAGGGGGGGVDIGRREKGKGPLVSACDSLQKLKNRLLFGVGRPNL